jgi:hypothetical protein
MAFKSVESGGQLATGNQFVQRKSYSTTQPVAAGAPKGHGSQQGSRKHFPPKAKAGLKDQMMGNKKVYTPGIILGKV